MQKKNILIVSDVFRDGGLETQICTYRDTLAADRTFFYALGVYEGTIPLPEDKVFDGFAFTLDETLGDFVTNVRRLCEIIRENKIDLIHCHPFYCFYSAVFAAQLTKTPIVYFFHGIGSFNFRKSVIESLLFSYAFESGAVGEVFLVNRTGDGTFSRLGCPKECFLPNPIDVSRFPKATYIKNKTWALVSRLDAFKAEEIKALLLKKDEFGIDKIDVVGDGAARAELEYFVAKEEIHGIQFLGYTSDVFASVNGKYNGVIGIGRVVLEALVMGLPAFLIGYGRVSGFVDETLYRAICDYNFTSLNTEYTNHKLPSHATVSSLSKKARSVFSSARVCVRYTEEIDRLTHRTVAALTRLFTDLEALATDESWQKILFCDSRGVYDLIKKHILPATLSQETVNLFATADLSYTLHDALYARQESTADELLSKISEQ